MHEWVGYRDWVARRRVFVIAFVLAALAACGEVLGGDDDPTAPPRPNEDAGNDGTVNGGDGAGPDGGGDSSDGGGSTCTADGVLELDPTFGAAVVTLDQPKSALSSAGVIGTVGKCRDGGNGLELARTSPDAAVTSATTCFGSDSMEFLVSISPTTQGWVVSGGRYATYLHARVVHVTDTGAELDEAELSSVTSYQSSLSQFALQVGGEIVWGGWRYGTAVPNRGFLKILGKPGTTELPPGEVPIAAGASGNRIIIAFIRELDGGTRELVVSRYDVTGGVLTKDVTYQPPLLAVTATQDNFDGLGSILVEGDDVTIAGGQGSALPILTFAKGMWSQETQAALGKLHLARTCDGALVVGGAVDLGSGSREQGLIRRIGGAPDGGLKLPDQNLPFVRLLRHSNGDLYAFQSGGGSTTARRVLP